MSLGYSYFKDRNTIITIRKFKQTASLNKSCWRSNQGHIHQNRCYYRKIKRSYVRFFK